MSAGVRSSSLPRPKESVVFKEVPEGAILFCTRTEVYYALNSVGVRIWHSLHPVCASEAEVVMKLSAEFPDVNLGRIAADVRRLIADLSENGLVESQRAA